jgi:hypothetical protein
VDDKQEILNHIHGIFRAYMDADTATIRATHSVDWTGFNSQSRTIVRGIDQYMANANRALSNSRIVRYALEETDVQIHGETAIVYYVANWSVRVNGLDQLVRIHARSVDVYQRRSGEWIQIGSNLNILPRPGAVSKEICEPCFDVALED